ncbi:hypothetical protein KR52_14180 [Synechococcus sp. KORDI-52]|nr:hypothetical protein KR52_14180 [Synechococcus sp. KORDI-52]
MPNLVWLPSHLAQVAQVVCPSVRRRLLFL